MLVCVAGYGIIASVTKEDEADTSSSSDITITDFGAKSVALMRWNYTGKEFSLTKTDDVWYDETNLKFPVAQNYPSSMSSEIASMTATRKLTDVTNLAEYGLDKPALSVSIMTDTGGELSFVFGDQNSVSGEYYMQYSQGSIFEPNSDVYLVKEQAVKAFSYTMDQLVQFEQLPDLSSINSIKVEANEDYRLSYMGKDDVIPWVLRDDEGIKYSANTKLCEELVSALKTLSFKRCVSYETGKADLSEFGLDDPWVSITVDYTVASEAANSTSEADAKSDSITFMLGNVNEEGEYYILVDGYKMLYTVDPAIGDWVKANNVTGLTDIAAMS